MTFQFALFLTELRGMGGNVSSSPFKKVIAHFSVRWCENTLYPNNFSPIILISAERLSPLFHPHVHTFLKYRIKYREASVNMHLELTKMFNIVSEKILDTKITRLSSVASACYPFGIHYCNRILFLKP